MRQTTIIQRSAKRTILSLLFLAPPTLRKQRMVTKTKTWTVMGEKSVTVLEHDSTSTTPTSSAFQNTPNHQDRIHHGLSGPHPGQSNLDNMVSINQAVLPNHVGVGKPIMTTGVKNAVGAHQDWQHFNEVDTNSMGMLQPHGCPDGPYSAQSSRHGTLRLRSSSSRAQSRTSSTNTTKKQKRSSKASFNTTRRKSKKVKKVSSHTSFCWNQTKNNFRVFCNQTSLHGWQYIAQKHTSTAKHVFWAIIVFLSMGTAFFFLYNNTMDFMDATVRRFKL